MDPNPLSASAGTIIIGFLLVIVAAMAFFLLGAWITTRMRRSRVREETDISYPANPRSADDRRAVAEVRSRETSGASPIPDGAGHPLRQSPARAERPVDAGQGERRAPEEPPTSNPL
ncbi:MAG: hypothetical protein OHK0015_30920 [Chloroflexi bacterium OHK40]